MSVELPFELVLEIFIASLDNDARTGVKLLRLCKAAYRLLTPFVYASVTVKHPRMIVLLARTFYANSILASFVRSLWVGSLASGYAFIPPAHVIDEGDWRTDIFPNALCTILSRCANLSRLAMIQCPLVSLPEWSKIERSFPPRLKTIAMGPDHAMLNTPKSYASVERFISVDTTLVHMELARIATLPCLRYLEWRFLSDSSVMKLEDPKLFGHKLSVVLESDTLRRVRVLHDDARMPRDWAIHCCDDQRVEFVRRKHRDKFSVDWVIQLYEEWKKDGVSFFSERR